MKKYMQIINEINNCLIDFNQIIKVKYAIPLICMESLKDTNYFVPVIHQEWDSWSFPNGGDTGIYFIFAKHKDKIGLYIGKASFKSNIGKRLTSHLSKDRNNANYILVDNENTKFIVQYILSIPLISNKNILSNSLEEYLILNLKSKILLFNKIGNYKN
jgi:hypothetical protein